MDKNMSLEWLQQLNFDGTCSLQQVWASNELSSIELHERPLRKLLAVLMKLNECPPTRPLGQVVVGPVGSGKTHLLHRLRIEVEKKDCFFILCDLIDVSDFWNNVMSAFIRSLLEKPDGVEEQIETLVDILFSETPLGKKYPSVRKILSASNDFENNLEICVNSIRKTFKCPELIHGEVIRALLLLVNPDYRKRDVGTLWLKGGTALLDDYHGYGFKLIPKESQTSATASVIDKIRALSWIMNVAGNTVVCFDQFDAFFLQFSMLNSNLKSEQKTDEYQQAEKQLLEITAGFMGLWDVLSRSMIVLTCMEASWDLIKSKSVQSVKGRFDTPIKLEGLSEKQIEALITSRLDKSQLTSKVQGGYYRTYPFTPQVIEQWVGLNARVVLNNCAEHVQLCRNRNILTELLPALRIDQWADIKSNYQEFIQSVDVTNLRDELRVGDLLNRWMLQTIVTFIRQYENHPKMNNMSLSFKDRFDPHNHDLNKGIDIQIHLNNIRDKEEVLNQYSFSLLPCHHPRSFTSKLKPAIVGSGIRNSGGCCYLMLVYLGQLPSGSTSITLTNAAQSYGSTFCPLTNDDLRHMWALAQLLKCKPPGFNQWLKTEFPLNQLTYIKNSGILKYLPSTPEKSPEQLNSLSLSTGGTEGNGSLKDTNIEQNIDDKTEAPLDQEPKVRMTDVPSELKRQKESDLSEISPSEKHTKTCIPLGKKNSRGQWSVLDIETFALRKHGVILAGAGSGKTVLVKRIIEECALHDIPSVIIDGANDMTRLGTPWPQSPSNFTDQDKFSAKRYFDSSETLIWTPGLRGGNPLFFNVMPDLQHLKDEPDDLSNALQMVHQSLLEIAVSGTGQTAKLKSAILMEALKDFYAYEKASLTRFIEYLKDLPPEVGGAFGQSAKLAQELADALLAEMTTNPMLNSEGEPINPSSLFGLDSAKTRISVINLMGLQGDNKQQQFVNQFSMGLFTWMKKHPTPHGKLGGLIIVDEAKDFVPSRGKSLSKDSLVRLTAQARKYGFGVIFATQSPKSIDHNVIANATTHWYGKAGSTTAIETIKKQIQNRGGDGSDVARLGTGEFYVYTEGFKRPEKIKTSLCLSYHPDSPPSEGEVLSMAKQSKLKLKA